MRAESQVPSCLWLLDLVLRWVDLCYIVWGTLQAIAAFPQLSMSQSIHALLLW